MSQHQNQGGAAGGAAGVAAGGAAAGAAADRQADRSSTPIPISLRQLFDFDEGEITVVSLDIGTGFSCVYFADGVLQPGGRLQMKSPPILFQGYPDNFNTRPETLKEIPTLSAHVFASDKPETARYGNQASRKAGKNIFVARTMKEALYSGDEGRNCRQELADAALQVPYLVKRYQGTAIEERPGIWFLADFVHWLADVILQSLQKNSKTVAWVITIPANWDRRSNALYADALNTSPILEKGFVFQAEVECAIAGVLDRDPQATMETQDIFFALDIGKGTSVGHAASCLMDRTTDLISGHVGFQCVPAGDEGTPTGRRATTPGR